MAFAILPEIQKDLDILTARFNEYLDVKSTEPQAIVSYPFQKPGKLLRPACFLVCCHMLHYHEDQKYILGSVCEFIHIASLLHDDVIDEAKLRRNRFTSSQIFGPTLAILSGDYIYATACHLMTTCGSFKVLNIFTDAVRQMSLSEITQWEVLWDPDKSSKYYDSIIAGKTAGLFSACFEVPAVLAKASEAIQLEFKKFGFLLGKLFQMTDDYLDYVGTTGELGKERLKDLKTGKITLPLLYAMEESRELSLRIKEISFKKEITETELLEIQKQVTDSGGLEKTQKKMSEIVLELETSLENFKKNNFHVPTLEFLHDMMTYWLVRHQ
jgi:octaprenyl-diphosphate synthase